MKRFAIGMSAVMTVLMLVGCSYSGGRPARTPSPTPSVTVSASTATPTPSAQRWTAVSDGTWKWGDVALGQPVTQRLSDYAITITATPTMTTNDGGKTITVSSRLSVTRVGDRGFGEDVTDSERVFFVPGNYGYPQHDEVYGIDPDFECEIEQLTVGQTSDCIVAFRAPSEEIQDFYWEVNGQNAAAWPSQVP